MRIGIYCGRLPALEQRGIEHALARYLTSTISGYSNAVTKLGVEDELVFYLERRVFTDAVWNEIDKLPILFEEQENLSFVRAAGYFQRLPNGARCRVLFRYLPGEGLPDFWQRLIDKLYLVLLCRIDSISLLHVLAPIGPRMLLPRVGCPLVVTISEPATVRGERLADKYLVFSREVEIALAKELGGNSDRILRVLPPDSPSETVDGSLRRGMRTMREVVADCFLICRQLILSYKAGY